MSNKMKWILIASVFLVVGGIGSVLTYSKSTGKNIILEQKVIQNRDVNVINIDSNNASIIILPTDEEKITVELSGKEKKDIKNKLTVDVTGSTLKVTFKEFTIISFGFDFSDYVYKIKVHLPQKQYDELVVNNDNGLISVEKLAFKEINAETNNGKITLTDTDSKSVHVEADNGLLSLKNVSGAIYGETNNGKISVVTKDMDRHMELSTDNGVINIKTEKKPTNAKFDVDIDNGTINIFDQFSGNAVFGDGKYLIKLSADNGAIKVRN